MKRAKELATKYGDTLVEYTPGKGISPTNKHRVDARVTIICGKCGLEDIRSISAYANNGNCSDCVKQNRSDEMRNTEEDIKKAIEEATTLKVIRFDKEEIYLLCGKHHTTNKTLRELRALPWCSICAKSDSSVRTKVPIVIGKAENVQSTQNVDISDNNQLNDVPDGYIFCQELDAKHNLYKCPEGHIIKIEKDAEIVCTFDDVGRYTDAQPTYEFAQKLASRSDILLSKYVNSKLYVELQCGDPECGNTVFYKTPNMYMSKDSVCPKCTDRATQQRKRLENIQWGIRLKREVELWGWTWLDEVERYEDQTTKFKVMCEKKHLTEVCSRDFINGDKDCYYCGREAVAAKLRMSLNDVRIVCSDAGFELMDDTYKNNKNTVLVKCGSCYSVNNIKLESIRNGVCPECNNSKSSGELFTQKALDSIAEVESYDSEFSFSKHDMKKDTWFSCRGKAPLRFDFRVQLTNGTMFFIECDGGQHFKAIDYFGGLNAFKQSRYYDFIKTAYCEYNNFPLLRISHKDYSNCASIIKQTIQDLTTKRNVCTYLFYSNKQDYSDFIKEYESFEPPDNNI